MKFYYTFFSFIRAYGNIVTFSVFTFYLTHFIFIKLNLFHISQRTITLIFLLSGLLFGFMLIPLIHFFRIKKYKILIDQKILWHRKSFEESNYYYSRKITNSNDKIISSFLLFNNYLVSFHPYYNNAFVLTNDSIGFYIGKQNSLALWFLNFEHKTFVENIFFIKFEEIKKIELNLNKKAKNINSTLQLNFYFNNNYYEKFFRKIKDYCYDKSQIKNNIFENNMLTLRIGEYFSYLYLKELNSEKQRDKIRNSSKYQKEFINKLNNLYPIKNYNII